MQQMREGFMRLRFCFVVTAMLLVLACSPSRAQTPTLKVGVPSLSMFTIMFHIAQDKGFFAKDRGMGVGLQ